MRCIDKVFANETVRSLDKKVQNDIETYFEEFAKKWINAREGITELSPDIQLASADKLFIPSGVDFRTWIKDTFKPQDPKKAKEFETMFSRENLADMSIEEFAADVIWRKINGDKYYRLKRNYAQSMKVNRQYQYFVQSYNHLTSGKFIKRDKNGNKIQAKDADGNLIYKTDSEGNNVTDSKGNLIPLYEHKFFYEGAINSNFGKPLKVGSKEYKIFNNQILSALNGDKTELGNKILQGFLYNNHFKLGPSVESLRYDLTARFLYKPFTIVREQWDNPNMWQDIKKEHKTIESAMNSDNFGNTWGEYKRKLYLDEDPAFVLNDKGELPSLKITETIDGVSKQVDPNPIAKMMIEQTHANFLKQLERNTQFNGYMTLKSGAGKTFFLRDAVNDNYDKFINDMVERMDDEIVQRYTGKYFDPVQEAATITVEKRNIAKSIADDIVSYSNKFPTSSKEVTRDKTLFFFKTGADEVYMHKTYGADTRFQNIYNQQQGLVRESMLTEMFGTNPEKFFALLEKKLTGTKTHAYLVKVPWWPELKKRVLEEYSPATSGTTTGEKFMLGLRNINYWKLGMQIFDQLTVEPMQAYVATKQLKWKGLNKKINWKSFHPIFGQFQKWSLEINGKNYTPKEKKELRNFVAGMGISIQKITGTTNLRMMEEMNALGNTTGLLGKTEQLTNKLFDITQSTAMADMQSDLYVNMLRWYVSDQLNKSIKWRNLQKQNPYFYQSLLKVGLTEREWNRMVQQWEGSKTGAIENKLFDEDGLINIYSLSDFVNKSSVKEVSDTFSKMHRFFMELTDNKGRLRPTDEIRSIMAFGDNPRMRSFKLQVMKAVMQFKSFAISTGVKQFGEMFRREGLPGVFKFAGLLTVYSILPAMINIQMREIASGRKLLDPLDSEIYERALTRLPSLGVLSVIPLMEWMVQQHIIRVGYNMIADEDNQIGYESRYDAQQDFDRYTYGMLFSTFRSLFLDVAEKVPKNFREEDSIIKAMGDSAWDVTEPIMRYLAPSAPLWNVFKNQIFETLDYIFDNDQYWRNQSKRSTDAEKQRWFNTFGNAENPTALTDFPFGPSVAGEGIRNTFNLD